MWELGASNASGFSKPCQESDSRNVVKWVWVCLVSRVLPAPSYVSLNRAWGNTSSHSRTGNQAREWQGVTRQVSPFHLPAVILPHILIAAASKTALVFTEISERSKTFGVKWKNLTYRSIKAKYLCTDRSSCEPRGVRFTLPALRFL